MKNQKSVALTILAAVVLSLGMVQQAQAQLRDDDSSISYLAVQIGASAGYSSENYRRYAEKLAKTMSHLAPDQQATVFGFMPSPSGGPAGIARSETATSFPNSSPTNQNTPGGIDSQASQAQPIATSPHTSWWESVKEAISQYFQSRDAGRISPTITGDGNNGGGNDPGRVDLSNPGKGNKKK